ncbi:hypothetical protein C8D87_104188 [Lentzea atacamensis]|uniref:Uncharacterized protein n=1 Tax=Lentzea atacamensis TaxID=531938 RepID=A0ABX9E7I5_9PSEU|nr:hypothetical protein C8D87_104188 [Lentzea atacamensis]
MGMGMEAKAIGEFLLSLATPLIGGLVALVLVAVIAATVEAIDNKRQDSRNNQEETP